VFADLGLSDAAELDTKLRLAVAINRQLESRRLNQAAAAVTLSLLDELRAEAATLSRLALYAHRARHQAPDGIDPAMHTPQAVVSRMKADGAICVKTFFERGYSGVRDLPVPKL